MHISFHWMTQWIQSRKGPRSCPAGSQAPLGGAPPSLSPRLRDSAFLREERTATPRGAPPLPASRQSATTREARCTAVTLLCAIGQPCGEVKLSNVIHTPTSSGLSHYCNIFLVYLCWRSGAISSKSWIIRQYNGLSEVSYFGCCVNAELLLFTVLIFSKDIFYNSRYYCYNWWYNEIFYKSPLLIYSCSFVFMKCQLTLKLPLLIFAIK